MEHSDGQYEDRNSRNKNTQTISSKIQTYASKKIRQPSIVILDPGSTHMTNKIFGVQTKHYWLLLHHHNLLRRLGSPLHLHVNNLRF